MPARLHRVLYTPTRRPRTPWRILATTLLVLAVAIVAVAGALAAGLPVDPATADGRAAALALLVSAVASLALAVTAGFAARRIDRRLLVDLGVRFASRDRVDAIAGGLLGMGLVAGVIATGLAVGVYDVALEPAAPPGYPLAVWIAVVVAFVLATATAEEVLLRGYLLTNLAEGFTAVLEPRAAVVAALGTSAALFGALHGLNPGASPLGVLTVAVAGVLLGLGYVTTESLALPIGIHATWNLTLALTGLPVSGLRLDPRLIRTAVTGPSTVHGGAFGPEGGLLGLGAVALGCPLVYAYARLTDRGVRGAVAVPGRRPER